jgi:hypothetical protein
MGSTGMLTALANGTSVIYGKYEQGSTQTIVTVSAATLSAITLSPLGTTISVGGTQ